MEKETNQKYIELLKQKLACVDELRQCTKLETFTGLKANADKEAEQYIIMYEKRENIFTKIKGLDEKMQSAVFKGIADCKDEQFIKEYELLKQAIRQIATELIELDNENIKLSQSIMVNVRDNIKQLKQGRDMSSRYNTDAMMPEGYYFDKKN